MGILYSLSSSSLEKAEMIKKKRKVVYSFRTNQKAALEAVAKKDSRTVSNIVGIAIQQFLARRKL